VLVRLDVIAEDELAELLADAALIVAQTQPKRRS
jgi:hypothetical protein